jgi:hypothetical protein
MRTGSLRTPVFRFRETGFCGQRQRRAIRMASGCERGDIIWRGVADTHPEVSSSDTQFRQYRWFSPTAASKRSVMSEGVPFAYGRSIVPGEAA